MKCIGCNGKGEVASIGYMQAKCQDCDGSGIRNVQNNVVEEVNELPIVNHSESSEPNVDVPAEFKVKKRLGRPPKSLSLE
jgi:DnaJ-class molecular chaperone